MSKFCENCGNLMNDNDMVCSACGAPNAAQAAQNGFDPFATNSASMQYVSPVQPMAPANKSADLIKKYLPIGVGAVAVIVVLVIIIACAGGGYKKVIKKFVEAALTDDADTYASLMSTVSNDGDELDADDCEFVVDFVSEAFEDEYGEFKSAKIKVTDVDKKDKDDIEELCEDCDCDEDIVKKYYEVETEITIIGEDDESDEEEVTFYMIKEKDGWKVCASTLYSSFIDVDY